MTLAEWKLTGWRVLFGHAPNPDDIVIPSRRKKPRSVSHMLKKLNQDLERLGLRKRRQQDARRVVRLPKEGERSLEVLAPLVQIERHPADAEPVQEPWRALGRGLGKAPQPALERHVPALGDHGRGLRQDQADERAPFARLAVERRRLLVQAGSLEEAWTIYGKLASGVVSVAFYHDLASAVAQNAPVLAGLAVFLVAEWVGRRSWNTLAIADLPLPLRWAAYTGLTWLCVGLGTERTAEFIYFRF